MLRKRYIVSAVIGDRIRAALVIALFASCAVTSPVDGICKPTHSAFGLDPGISPSLCRNAKPTQYSIDQFGPFVQPFHQTLDIALGEKVTVRGWAIDAPAAKLASSVEIVIDGCPYALPYFLSRGDVVAALRTETYSDCGFLGIVSPELLPAGLHTVSFRIISADRKTYYQTPAFHVRVRAI